jgi:tetratricopeptide (TPR) repeat protein
MKDTEKAYKELKANYSTREDIWRELAAALYKKGDLESARRYASRVDTDIRRYDEYMRRIVDNLPSDTLSINTHASAYGSKPVRIPLPSEDPGAANRILEEVIALTERNPIESTQGQFGPWNQKFQLARIKVQYGLVAALYRKAGNQEQAKVKLKLAEEAFQTLAKEELGFGAIFAVNELQGPLIHLQDAEGLRSLTENSNVPMLSWAADLVVPDMLLSGDIEAAKKLAQNTLSGKRDFPLGTGWSKTGDHGPSTGSPSKIVSCFIEAGELDKAFELVKSSKPNRFTAAACENAGRAMVKKDHGLLTKPNWRTVCLRHDQSVPLVLTESNYLQEHRF